MEYTASKVWELYQKGIDYLNKKHLITDTNQAWNFYLGNQWEGLKSGNKTMPFHNFIHPTVMRFPRISATFLRKKLPSH